MRLGVLIGALSALLVAVFGSLNKRLVSHADPLTVTALELGAGTVTLTVLAPLLPFLLDGVALQPGLMQADGLHPTAKAQPRVLDNVWPHLKPLL